MRWVRGSDAVRAPCLLHWETETMGNDWSERCADCGRRPVDGYGAYSVVYCCRAAYEDHKAAECSCTEAEPRTATRPRKRRTSRPAFGVDNHDR